MYAKDLDPKVVDQVWERFLAALDPLHQAGKLGALLFQFPQWFPIGRRNKEYVLECKRRADTGPLIWPATRAINVAIRAAKAAPPARCAVWTSAH